MSGSTSTKPPFSTTPFYGYTPSTGAIPMQPQPPPHPVAIPTFPADPNSQQFYDFQWRVLTLCYEFYNAADELIVSYERPPFRT